MDDAAVHAPNDEKRGSSSLPPQAQKLPAQPEGTTNTSPQRGQTAVVSTDSQGKDVWPTGVKSYDLKNVIGMGATAQVRAIFLRSSTVNHLRTWLVTLQFALASRSPITLMWL